MFYSELDFWGITYEKAKKKKDIDEDKDKEIENLDDFISKKKQAMVKFGISEEMQRDIFNQY